MPDPTQLTTETLLRELGRRLAELRVDSGQTQEVLARNAGVSKRTVERLEAGGSVQLANFIGVLRALNLLAGIDALVPALGPNPLDLARLARGRERVRAPRARATDDEPWTWGDER